jgi:hypothetical protein
MPDTGELSQTEIPPLRDLWERDCFAPIPSTAKPIEVEGAEMEVFTDREALEKALPSLSKQACVALALRAAKRARVFVELRNTATEGIAAGFVISVQWARGAVDAAVRADAEAEVSAHAVADAKLADAKLAVRAAACAADRAAAAFYAAASAADDSTDYLASASTASARTWKATSFDFARLKKVALLTGAPPLTGWDDPRLGPLWPEGAPEWHKKAEQELRELKAKLANRPDPFASPIPDGTRRQLVDLRKIDELAKQGAFQDLHGQYVLVYDGQLVGHGPDLGEARQLAAEKCGVPLSHLVYRYIY